MDLGIKGKSAIVCAASKGLGKGCAEALAREGVDVTICARGADALNATAKELASFGVKVTPVVCDVTTEEGGSREIGYAHEKERARVMCDLVRMSLACDLTRSVSLMITCAQSFMNVVALPGLGHECFLEAPGTVHAAIRAFLASCEERTADGIS